MIDFEWDEEKARSNLVKHGVSFADAELAFADEFAVVLSDSSVDDEDRLHLIGSSGGLLLLLVVHTYRERHGQETIRIISARGATQTERRVYHQAQLRS